MKKLIRRIIAKLIKWAIKEELEATVRISQQLATQIYYLNQCSDKHSQKIDLIESVIDVGISASSNPKMKSWAVICLNGKKEQYVNFVDLDDSSVREIEFFIRKFERSNMIIDTEPTAKAYLNDRILHLRKY